MFSLPAAAQQGATAGLDTRLDELFAQLQRDGVDSAAVEAEILDLWSRSGSDSMDLLLQRADAALAQGDTETAIGFYSALIDHAPDFAQGYAARADAYMAAGLFGPALADLESALALEPRHFGALETLASILEEVGSAAEARAAWELLATLAPHDPRVIEALDRPEGLEDGLAL